MQGKSESMLHRDSPPRSQFVTRHVLLLIIAYIGFISLGLPDAITGIAWPELRKSFVLPQVAYGSISLALGTAYFLSSFFAGQLTQRLGIGLLLALSSLLVALAMLGNSVSPLFAIVLACIFAWGLGSGAIDAGLNHYAASHFSSVHMNWLHACYSLGASAGPFLMTAAVVGGGSWRLGYAIVGSIVLALAMIFIFTVRWWDRDQVNIEKAVVPATPVTMRETLGLPLVWLQIMAFACYTGLEFMIGGWTNTLLIESRQVVPALAGVLVGVYFGSIFLGRVVLGGLTHWIGVDVMLRSCTVVVVLGALLFATAPTLWMSIAGLVLLGFGLAPIFPGLMSRTPARLGKNHAVHAVGFQVSAATIGGAACPALAAVLAEKVGLESVAQFAVLLAAAIWVMHELLLRSTAGFTSTTVVPTA